MDCKEQVSFITFPVNLMHHPGEARLMLRNLFLTTSVFAALSGAAFAADLPSRVAAPTLEAPPVFTWTGFYVGSTVGGMTLDSKVSYTGSQLIPGDVIALDEGPGSYDQRFTTSTVTVGGTAGYNYQIANIVLGLEADYNWANIKDLDNSGSTMDGFGTVRGRLGLAWDRALLYVTGGFAFSNLKSCCGYDNSSASFGTGWTIGTGVEYAIMPHVSIKLEGLYMDFGKKNVAGCDGGFYKVKNTATVGRVGLNYRF